MRRASGAQRRHLSDDALLVHIKAIHAETTWWLRLAAHLEGAAGTRHPRGQGAGAKAHAAARHPRQGQAALQGHHRQQTRSADLAQPAEPRIHREQQPDKVWAGDITYIDTDEGWLFLAVVIDLFSRQVVGWSLREDMTRDIVIDALRMAWFKRHPGKQAGLIFHSDRGSQYASDDFRDVLTEYGMHELR